MAISYDKNALKRLHKQLKVGKKQYALKSSLYYSLFFYVFMIGLNYLFSLKDDNTHIDLRFFIKWAIVAIVMFIFDYFIKLKTWDGQKALYEESIKFHKENNPSFLDDLE